MSKYLKILHHYSYVPQIRTKGPAVWQTFLQNIPDQTALWNIGDEPTVWTCPPGRGNFHPAKLIPEIVRIFNLPETTILIGRKPQKPHLTSSIKHPSIANLHFLTCEYNFWGGGVQWHSLPLLLSLEHAGNTVPTIVCGGCVWTLE